MACSSSRVRRRVRSCGGYGSVTLDMKILMGLGSPGVFSRSYCAQ